MPSPFQFVPWLRSLIVPDLETVAQQAVRRGDDARARLDWAKAAAEYRAALEAKPGLVHIWIQLGHALKEQDELTPAILAYREAARLQSDVAEAHVFLAHIYKGLGQLEPAICYFLKALHAGAHATNESEELLRLLARQSNIDRPSLVALLAGAFEQLPPRVAEAPLLTELRRITTEDMTPPIEHAASADARPALVFDVSDLIGYFSHARLPTGIQRVQIEAIEGALVRDYDREIRLCCFIEGREEWLELPVTRMRTLTRLSTSSGDHLDPEWTKALMSLRILLSLTAAFEFPLGASLVNLGTSWWLQNYFLFVRHAKATRGIRYVPFVHDMIPIMAPQHCTRGLTQDFISWVIGVFDHADHFLVNSNATRNDLIAVAETLGYSLDPSDIAVIPLDTDFRKTGLAESPTQTLDQWQLELNEFVLFVSTVESRKGHLIAFDAWAELMERHGPDTIPQLVCVGNRGWLNDQIYERLATDKVLSRKVTMLSRLSDEELSLLYRTCLFTIYPSLYEGWGLPVTESLCYGKVPLLSDAASLPEAGGDFAVYAAAGSILGLTDAAELLILDSDWRAAAEARIASNFRPRAWSDLATQIIVELDRFADRDAHANRDAPPPPFAQIGAWHSMKRNEATRIWRGMRTGEAFRSGLGWHGPEGRGCRIKFEGGELTFRLAGPHPKLRMLVELGGDENGLSLWALYCGEATLEGELNVQETTWTWFEIPASDVTHDIMISFAARPAPDGVMITYFVRSFFLHAAEDLMARQGFLEAMVLGRLDTLDTFRER